jgi:hypothetical protein
LPSYTRKKLLFLRYREDSEGRAHRILKWDGKLGPLKKVFGPLNPAAVRVGALVVIRGVKIGGFWSYLPVVQQLGVSIGCNNVISGCHFTQKARNLSNLLADDDIARIVGMGGLVQGVDFIAGLEVREVNKR